MKLFKPIWVNHEDKPIFSIDIHPAGKRFATGGQGGDSGRVVVWNMSPVVYEHMETDPNVPKLLCQMDNHLACVNCVRWSNGGKYLASGGDDRLVMVWTLSGSSATPGSKHKTESWRCVSTLRGHAGDVLDLAWSPLDKWLASCSVDNSIIIWNGEKFPEMVCVLNGHTGLVKGVAWDPVGKYLASQSDDKSLRVWKTADWGQETVITDPFEDCGGTTHVLRLSWSPDGQYVVSAHAMNGGGPTAQVVERDGWRCDKDFVGHRKAVTCARFNNNILVKEGKKCCCAAVGSRDRALSIWLTSLKRPLVVVHDLFSDSVLDLCWSDDGLILLACSSDGSVACLQFTNQEIGTPLSLEEKNAFYEKTYGKCLANQSSGDLNTSNLLIECPEILLAREKQEANAKKEKESKEELTPKSEKSQNKLCSPSFVSSPGATPTRPVDRQIETRTSDGKRRITPVFIPLTTNPDGEPPGSSSENCFSTSSQSKSRIRVERRDDIIIHPNVSNHAPVRDKSPDAVPEPSLRKRAGAPLPGPRAPPAPAPARSPPPAHPAPRTDTPTCLPAAVLGAAGPVVRAAGPRRLQVVNNACSTPYGPLSKLQLLLNNSASSEPVWETYLGSPVNCVSCDARWIAAACESGVLHAWGVSPEGRVCRALPPVSLCGAAVRLALSAGVLVAVTVSARVCAWDLRRGSALLPAASIRPLLVPGVTLANCGLLDDGNVLLTMSNGNSYVYSKKLSSWVVWWSSSDPLWRCSGGSAWARPPTLGAKPQHAALARGEYASGAALSWLESRASAALQLRQAHEYKHWTLALVHHLATHGTENQLRNILDDMLGPSHCTSSPRTWETQILGIKKHDMLEEMLSILVSQLRWQRLYAEYSDQLRDLRHVPDTLITPQHPLDTPQHPPDIPQHPHNGHPDVEMAC